MFDLPTHPDGSFYSISETNEIVSNISDKVSEIEDEVTKIEAEKYKIECKKIPENSDLDNYIEPGYYNTDSSSVTETITNKPTGFTSSFIMMVLSFSSSTFIQIIFTGSKIFCRRKTSTGFAKWYEYTGTQQS